MSYILEDAKKTISNLCKFDHQAKKRFQTKLRLQNRFFVKETARKLLLKVNNV